MKHWGVKAGDKVGVIGFGGLGDMAAKLARAIGAEVTVFTRRKEKVEKGDVRFRYVIDMATLKHDEAASTELRPARILMEPSRRQKRRQSEQAAPPGD